MTVSEVGRVVSLAVDDIRPVEVLVFVVTDSSIHSKADVASAASVGRS